MNDVRTTVRIFVRKFNIFYMFSITGYWIIVFNLHLEVIWEINQTHFTLLTNISHKKTRRRNCQQTKNRKCIRVTFKHLTRRVELQNSIELAKKPYPSDIFLYKLPQRDKNQFKYHQTLIIRITRSRHFIKQIL